MSEFNNTKISPPRSLMNLENAEKIWEIINKRYPKVAPLLCEMESVLDQAEDLLNQLQLSSSLEKIHSVDESSNVNLEGSSENENLNSNTSILDLKNSEDQEPNLSDGEQEILDATIINETSSLVLRETPGDDDEAETEESLAILTNVVRTLKRSEDNKSIENCEENLETNTDTLQTKTSETESSDSWSEVMGDSSESNESFFTKDATNSGIARSEEKRKEMTEDARKEKAFKKN